MIPYSKTYDISFIDRLPTDRDRYLLDEANSFPRRIKFFRRLAYMAIKGQLPLERQFISKSDGKILWINLSAPSLGDSIMDLSGRVLLAGRTVHLLTSSKNKSLYEFDSIFSKVADCCESLDSDYDLIIMDSYSHRSFENKIRRWLGVPFVGLYGFVNGFEVHRTLFNYYRIAELLGIAYDNLRPNVSIFIPKNISVDIPDRPFITVVVGAEWEFRRYHMWDEVLNCLEGKYEVVLVGSSNGEVESFELQSRRRLVNYVGKLSLMETAFVISKASFQICADGGLWHVACALGTPSVCLFADCQLFLGGKRYYRNTEFQRCIPLYSDHDVSDIGPNVVILGIERCCDEYCC